MSNEVTSNYMPEDGGMLVPKDFVEMVKVSIDARTHECHQLTVVVSLDGSVIESAMKDVYKPSSEPCTHPDTQSCWGGCKK